jgi:hypothetical protein
VGYWTFDEGTGSTTYDYSGQNATGSWQGTASGNNNTYYTAGKVGGYAGQFDGTNNWVAIPNIARANQFTDMAWIKPNLTVGCTSENICAIISQYFSVFPGSSYLAYYDNGLTPSGWFKTNNGVIGNNVWQHVALTYDGSNVNLYINGSLSAQAPASRTGALGSRSCIGSASCAAASRSFNGPIDDVRIYSRALSTAEIAAIYNGGK